MERVDVLVAEADWLKKEQTERIKSRNLMRYSSLVVTIGAIGAAANFRSTALLLALAPICFALGWQKIADDQKVSRLGEYFRTVLKPELEQLAAGPVLMWETFYREDRRDRQRMVLHFLVDLIVFVLPGFGGAIAWLVTSKDVGGAAGLTVTSALPVFGCAALALVLAWQFGLYAEVRRTADR